MFSMAAEVGNLFTAADLDRGCGGKRPEPQFLASVLDAPSTRLIAFHKTRPLVRRFARGEGGDAAELVRLPVSGVDPSYPIIVLGLEKDEAGSQRYICAIDVSSSDEGRFVERTMAAVAGSGFCFCDARELVVGPASSGVKLKPCRPEVSFAGSGWLRAGPLDVAWPVPAADVALLGLARGLIIWHKKSAHCGVCGKPNISAEGGVKKRCSDSSCGESNYPRTDPVVISLVQSHCGNKILLCRQPAFPPNYFSCVAGFLEGAESIEEAVRREVMEECGIKVGKVQFFSSQPWPLGRGLFNQVMLGCLATVDEGASESITIDPSELADAQWYDRDAVARALGWYYDGAEVPAAGPETPKLRVPGPFAIAHQLLKAWLRGDAESIKNPQ